MKEYCNSPTTCDDFHAANREILGRVQLPPKYSRTIYVEGSREEGDRGSSSNTTWWQVP